LQVRGSADVVSLLALDAVRARDPPHLMKDWLRGKRISIVILISGGNIDLIRLSGFLAS
jgi:hypothetical protein